MNGDDFVPLPGQPQPAFRTVVTFGSNHEHPVSGLNLGHHYVVVTGRDYEDCRRQTIERFGNRWAFDYADGPVLDGVYRSAEDQAGVDRFELIEIDLVTGIPR
jgi:hypothetical protein